MDGFFSLQHYQPFVCFFSYTNSKQFLFHYVEMQTKCYTKHDEIEKGERDKNVCIFSQQRK